MYNKALPLPKSGTASPPVAHATRHPSVSHAASLTSPIPPPVSLPISHISSVTNHISRRSLSSTAKWLLITLLAVPATCILALIIYKCGICGQRRTRRRRRRVPSQDDGRPAGHKTKPSTSTTGTTGSTLPSPGPPPPPVFLAPATAGPEVELQELSPSGSKRPKKTEALPPRSQQTNPRNNHKPHHHHHHHQQPTRTKAAAAAAAAAAAEIPTSETETERERNPPDPSLVPPWYVPPRWNHDHDISSPPPPPPPMPPAERDISSMTVDDHHHIRQTPMPMPGAFPESVSSSEV